MDKKDVDNTDENLGVPPELIKFFYLSFKYSQGSMSLQKHIFDFAAEKKVFGNIPNSMPLVLLDKLMPPKYHARSLSTSYKLTFQKEWKEMSESFSKKWKRYNRQKLVYLMLLRDIRFISDVPGRDVKAFAENPVPDSDSDPYVSFVRKYALQGESTNDPVFDRMFLEVKNELLKENTPLKGRLEELARWCEKKHSGHTFSPGLKG